MLAPFDTKILLRKEETTYGYARILADAQDLVVQLNQLQVIEYGTIFQEKITGAHAERPQLKKLLAFPAPGDALVVPAVDRHSWDTIACGNGGDSGK